MCFALLSGCTDFDQDNSFVEKETCTNTSSAITRILDFANMEAEHFFPSASRSDMRVANPSDLKLITSNLSRSEEQDTLIYVVNFADNRGFALISAKDRQNPLLAIVPEGSYDPEIGTDNPGFNIYLDAAKQSIMRIGKIDPIEGNDPSIPFWENGKYVKIVETTIKDEKCEPKLGADFQWDQYNVFENIYGRYCPNRIAGCVPVAIASLITYFNAKNNRTTNISYNFDNRRINNESVVWNEIYKHKRTAKVYNNGQIYPDICTDSEASHETIGHLLRQIGKDANAQYKDSSTSVASNKILPTLKKYLPLNGFSDTKSFNSQTAKEDLLKGVMLVWGYENNKEDGHAWICDGFTYKKVLVKRYESDPPLLGETYNWELTNSTVREFYTNYMHWGWGGEYDGWYGTIPMDPGNDGVPFTNIKYILTQDVSLILK